MAKLVLSLNGTVLQQRFIDAACISIGRDAVNDIVIDDAALGGVHARIVTVGEDNILEDLQRAAGLRVNGSPVARQILHHRDVIELGAHHLCYLSSRAAAEIDLDRTMLINALPRQGAPTADGGVLAIPAARTAKVRLPEGCVKVLAGVLAKTPAKASRPAVGDSVRLDRVVTTFGIPGEQLVVIARRPPGYFLTHVEGPQMPRINQQSIDAAPRALRDGDLIEAAGYRLEFRLAPFAAGQ